MMNSNLNAGRIVTIRFYALLSIDWDDRQRDATLLNGIYS